jgi:hypothetical protein
VDNYRSISILRTVNKVFEKTIHTRISAFLERDKVLYDYQYDFDEDDPVQEVEGPNIYNRLITNLDAMPSNFIEFKSIDHI